MLFPSKMKQVSLLVHGDHLEPVVETLHESGLLQITDIHRETPERLENLEKASMHPHAGECATYELRLTRIIKILSRFAEKKSGVQVFLHPTLPEKKLVPHRSLQNILNEASQLLEKTEEMVVTSEEKIGEYASRLEELSSKTKIMALLSSFDLDISWIGDSPYLFLRAGITWDLQALTEALKTTDTAILSQEKREGKERFWVVVLIAHRSSDPGKTYKQFFEEFALDRIQGRPTDLLEGYTKEKEKIVQHEKKITKALQTFHQKYINNLLALREEILLEKARKEVPMRFARTQQVYLVEGWVLAKDMEKLENLVTDSTKGHVDCLFTDPPSTLDDVPIYLEMPRWARPFKTFLELFALPRYNEVNPSVILGVSFILFFAIMLGDAGYGVLILGFSLFGRIRLGKYSPLIRDWSFVGIWLGILTTIAGILFNGFFGDFVPRFIYGDTNLLLYEWGPFPIDAIHKPVTILVMSLILGLAHLNTGIILGIYKNMKNSNYRAILKKQAPWFFLQIGGGALVGNAMLHIWELSPGVTAVSGLFTGIGLLGLLSTSGAIGFFDLTGVVGDWLSYARLLALGLATAGMALAFNIVAEVFADMLPFVGFIILPLILIFAHFANFILQSLGAAIHSLRLQYVEFFNRFYEGGGKEFMPFKIKRKYTEVKK